MKGYPIYAHNIGHCFSLPEFSTGNDTHEVQNVFSTDMMFISPSYICIPRKQTATLSLPLYPLNQKHLEKKYNYKNFFNMFTLQKGDESLPTY